MPLIQTAVLKLMLGLAGAGAGADAGAGDGAYAGNGSDAGADAVAEAGTGTGTEDEAHAVCKESSCMEGSLQSNLELISMSVSDTVPIKRLVLWGALTIEDDLLAEVFFTTVATYTYSFRCDHNM
jgi:hypothetical protein